MMSSWKKVKRSGTFRRKVQKEREEMLKRALEVAEEFRKQREQNNRRGRSVKTIIFRPAVIMNNRQMVVRKLSPPSESSIIAPLSPTDNNIDDGNVGETMNSPTIDDASSSASVLGVYIYFARIFVFRIFIQIFLHVI